MLLRRNALVYCSKDRDDWEKARALLRQAEIEHSAWESEEPPAGGCGGKADPRPVLTGKKAIPRTIFKIEVAAAGEKAARTVLEGKVRPVQHYGFSI